MPAKPSAAAARRASTGKMHSSSQRAALGANSRAEKSRATSWMASCSSESRKSIAAAPRRPAQTLLRRALLRLLLLLALRLVLGEHGHRRRGAQLHELLIMRRGPF